MESQNYIMGQILSQNIGLFHYACYNMTLPVTCITIPCEITQLLIAIAFGMIQGP